MNSKIITFFALLAILFGCALCQQEGSSTIQLHVWGSSSKWWIAVDPRNERYETASVEVREEGSLQWLETTPSPGWGYFQLASTSGRGFRTPLTFRFTAANGERVVSGAFMDKITPGVVINTAVQYNEAPATGPTDGPYVPTESPMPPVERPTHAPTGAPTAQPSTKAPTSAPTAVPPTQPTAVPPTKAPTMVPTHAPTAVPPTKAPTQAPTKPPTQAPTKPPTQAPTKPPTQAPTKPPTQAPTKPPTQAPTKAPTQPPAAVDLCTVTSAKSEPIKILVPLYVYPGAVWDQLITVAQSGVPVIAIINPYNGPKAEGPDAAYKTYIKKLRDAGVVVVGYVHTLWGARPMSTIKAEIDLYFNKYPGVDGIFFDEAATEAGQIPYYRQAYEYVLSKNFHHSILNPGLQPAQGYVDISTNIVIFENYASELAGASYSSWVKCAPNAARKAGWKYKFSSIVHTASLSNMPNLIAQSHAKGMGLVYVTDGAGGCCTYNHLANYFLQQGSAVKALNS